jgi:hypothetical protein
LDPRRSGKCRRRGTHSWRRGPIVCCGKLIWVLHGYRHIQKPANIIPVLGSDCIPYLKSIRSANRDQTPQYIHCTQLSYSFSRAVSSTLESPLNIRSKDTQSPDFISLFYFTWLWCQGSRGDFKMAWNRIFRPQTDDPFAPQCLFHRHYISE